MELTSKKVFRTFQNGDGTLQGCAGSMAVVAPPKEREETKKHPTKHAHVATNKRPCGNSALKLSVGQFPDIKSLNNVPVFFAELLGRLRFCD